MSGLSLVNMEALSTKSTLDSARSMVKLGADNHAQILRHYDKFIKAQGKAASTWSSREYSLLNHIDNLDKTVLELEARLMTAVSKCNRLGGSMKQSVSVSAYDAAEAYLNSPQADPILRGSLQANRAGGGHFFHVAWNASNRSSNSCSD